MSETLTPFLKWGSYKSNDQNKPDILECKVNGIETFTTEYSENVKIFLIEGGNWEERIMPLKSHDSMNSQLIQLWNKAVKQNKLKDGKRFFINTWLGVSKNKRPIRRYQLSF